MKPGVYVVDQLTGKICRIKPQIVGKAVLFNYCRFTSSVYQVFISIGALKDILNSFFFNYEKTKLNLIDLLLVSVL